MSASRPTPDRVLRSPRLRLRAWSPDQAAELRAVLDANDAHLRPWIPFMAKEPRSLEETRAWLGEIETAFRSGEALRYRVERLEEERLLGEVMLIDRVGEGALEGGYWLARDAGGEGFAAEAMGRLCTLAFEELGATSVEFHCDERNEPSNALARRLGARQEGTIDVDGALGPARLNVWRLEAVRLRVPGADR